MSGLFAIAVVFLRLGPSAAAPALSYSNLRVNELKNDVKSGFTYVGNPQVRSAPEVRACLDKNDVQSAPADQLYRVSRIASRIHVPAQFSLLHVAVAVIALFSTFLALH
ncbi:hypothetical protein AB0M12_15920 [Nocardia vinacea]|uniref:hypothetical protein n=1 Tax=Nocardia vinacea TaxID=96468 RepID=UPI003425181B